MLSKNEVELKINPAVPLLKKYWELVLLWQKRVNLISNNTVPDGWNRHIIDSAQLYFYLPKSAISLMDIGSGAGFPAIVIAILNKILKGPLKKIILVESDRKKALFLEECVRILELDVLIFNQRIEDVMEKVDVITARAFASLKKILPLIQKNVSRETFLVLPKGKNGEIELKEACFKGMTEKIESCIDSESYIFIMKGVKDGQ